MPTKSALKNKKKSASTKPAATKRAATKKPAASTSRASTAKATEAKTSNGGKRAAAAEQNTKAMATVVKMRGQNKPWSEIAEAISTTPGKAQFLMMQHQVAQGEVPEISTNGGDAAVVKRLVAARAKDEYSSWGWLSARSGLTEGTIKKLLADAGEYEPRAENVAARRAANNGGGSSSTKTTGSTKPKPKAKPKAGSAATKAKAKARKNRSNPSK